MDLSDKVTLIILIPFVRKSVRPVAILSTALTSKPFGWPFAWLSSCIAKEALPCSQQLRHKMRQLRPRFLPQVEERVQRLRQSGFDLGKLSVVAMDRRAGEQVIAHYGKGGQARYWGN